MRSNNNRVTPERAYLSAVSAALKKLQSTQKLTQEALEQATGVDQTTISRARAGKLKRVTPKIQRVKRYADMRLERVQLSSEILNAAKAFLAAGGSEDELLASLRHVTRFVLRRGVEEGGSLEKEAR
jgi:transcriptional regulator with XRE-family HTH domain